MIDVRRNSKNAIMLHQRMKLLFEGSRRLTGNKNFRLHQIKRRIHTHQRSIDSAFSSVECLSVFLGRPRLPAPAELILSFIR